jgi:hypothetical protein
MRHSSAQPDPLDEATDVPELSPLWTLVVVLGEIALRLEAQATADEQHDPGASVDV